MGIGICYDRQNRSMFSSDFASSSGWTQIPSDGTIEFNANGYLDITNPNGSDHPLIWRSLPEVVDHYTSITIDIENLNATNQNWGFVCLATTAVTITNFASLGTYAFIGFGLSSAGVKQVMHTAPSNFVTVTPTGNRIYIDYRMQKYGSFFSYREPGATRDTIGSHRDDNFYAIKFNKIVVGVYNTGSNIGKFRFRNLEFLQY